MSTIRKLYSEAVKRQAVRDVESGELSISEAALEYGATKGAVSFWLKEYGRYRPKRDIVEVVMKSEKDRIAELEKALADSTLKNRIYEEIIDIADKKYKTDLKKTLGTKLSDVSIEKGTKSKSSARSSK